MGASESHGTEQRNGQNAKPEGDNTVTYGGARVGDWVDYESDGAIANPQPMRVRHVSEDGKWVFVDGSLAGLEMNQVIVAEPPVDAAKETAKIDRPTLPLPADMQPKVGTRKAVFPLREGDVALVYPEDLSARGLRELGMYLQIFLKNEEEAAGEEE
jgi:hypothetical protein